MSMQHVPYVTIFSTGGKFLPLSNLTELHTRTQATCSCVLLVTVIVQCQGFVAVDRLSPRA